MYKLNQISEVSFIYDDKKDYILINDDKMPIYLTKSFFSDIGYFFKKNFKENLIECSVTEEDKITKFLIKKEQIDKLPLIDSNQIIEKTPKKSYRTLNLLRKNKISFRYTPFDQGALVNVLSKKWLGACNHLSHNWLIQKALSNDFDTPVYYPITESHLPHPLIYDEKTVSEMNDELIKINDNQKLHYLTESEIDKQSDGVGVKAFCDFLSKYSKFYALIKVGVYVKDGYRNWNFVNHTLAVAKKDEQLVWFDPNYGEILFENLNDFEFWLEKESLSGCLKYFSLNGLKNNLSLGDYFPQPKFTKKERKSSLLAKRMIERREMEAHLRNKIEARVREYKMKFFYL
jgi:hypothetical protein